MINETNDWLVLEPKKGEWGSPLSGANEPTREANMVIMAEGEVGGEQLLLPSDFAFACCRRLGPILESKHDKVGGLLFCCKQGWLLAAV